jgi:hypothetical protein
MSFIEAAILESATGYPGSTAEVRVLWRSSTVLPFFFFRVIPIKSDPCVLIGGSNTLSTDNPLGVTGPGVEVKGVGHLFSDTHGSASSFSVRIMQGLLPTIPPHCLECAILCHADILNPFYRR